MYFFNLALPNFLYTLLLRFILVNAEENSPPRLGKNFILVLNIFATSNMV